MPFRIIRDNIVNVAADAIVNTANPRPVVGAGTDTAVYEAAGRESLLAERRKIGRIKRGDAAATPAFALPAKYIIHTVSTGWKGGHFGERKILASCYRRSLEVAKELGCESIAIPLLAAGSYRVPKDIALTIALDEIRQFLMENDMDVTLVVFDREAYALSANLLFDVQSFIDDETAASLHEEEYRYDLRRRNLDETVKNIVSDTDYADYAYPRRLAEEEEERSFGAAPDMWNRPAKAGPPVPPAAPSTVPFGAGGPVAGYGGKVAKKVAMPDFSDEALESAVPEEPAADFAKVEASEPADQLICAMAEPVEAVTDEMPDFTKVGMSFRDKLFELIDARGLTDPEVYKRANIDRKLFSKIRSSEEYTPKKKTALALAVALKLSLAETEDLIARAGYALSPSSRFDMIIKFFITHSDYDIYKINATLFLYDEPLLGL